MNWMDRAVDGEFADLGTSLLDAVDKWHAGDSEVSLHIHVGMTWDEYALWVEKPAALGEIVAARRAGR